MIEYKVTTDKRECLEARELYKQYYRSAFGDMKRIGMYSVAMDEDKIIGAIGIGTTSNPKIKFSSYMVIHPDYRDKTIRPEMFKTEIEYLRKDRKTKYLRIHSIPDRFRKNMKKYGFKDNKKVCDECLELYVGD